MPKLDFNVNSNVTLRGLKRTCVSWDKLIDSFWLGSDKKICRVDLSDVLEGLTDDEKKKVIQKRVPYINRRARKRRIGVVAGSFNGELYLMRKTI